MPEHHDFGHVKPRHRQVVIPDKNEHPWRYRWAVIRWRLALLTVTHTVGIAVAISFLIASVPAWLILVQAKRTTHLTHLVEHQRAGSVRVFCDQMNRNSLAATAQARYIEGLIVAGAKESKVFDRLLRQYGQPPYAARVKKAEVQARQLDATTVRPLDCNRFVAEIVALERRTR